MKKLLLLLLLPLFSYSQKCWHDEHRDKHFYYETPKIKVNYSEYINMGGVSTFRDCDKHVLYNKIDTKSPKIRETKKTFKHFIIHVFFSSNTDTGKDRLTILYAYHPIFEKELSVDEETLDLHFNFSDWDKLQFIVDNPSMPNASPGAFECRITIKEIRE